MKSLKTSSNAFKEFKRLSYTIINIKSIVNVTSQEEAMRNVLLNELLVIHQQQKTISDRIQTYYKHNSDIATELKIDYENKIKNKLTERIGRFKNIKALLDSLNKMNSISEESDSQNLTDTRLILPNENEMLELLWDHTDLNKQQLGTSDLAMTASVFQ